VKLFFNDATIFKTKYRYQLQPEENIRCALTTTSPHFNKLRNKILIEVCDVGDELNLLRLVFLCIIPIVLIYCESTNIYTGSEIVHVIKRLRNTNLAILYLGPDEMGQKGLMMWFTKKTETQNQKIFFHYRREDLPSLEDLNSSLAQSAAEIFTCKLLDFSLNHPAAKVLSISLPTIFGEISFWRPFSNYVTGLPIVIELFKPSKKSASLQVYAEKFSVLGFSF